MKINLAAVALGLALSTSASAAGRYSVEFTKGEAFRAAEMCAKAKGLCAERKRDNLPGGQAVVAAQPSAQTTLTAPTGTSNPGPNTVRQGEVPPLRSSSVLQESGNKGFWAKARSFTSRLVGRYM